MAKRPSAPRDPNQRAKVVVDAVIERSERTDNWPADWEARTVEHIDRIRRMNHKPRSPLIASTSAAS
jgi:hypothetical protein